MDDADEAVRSLQGAVRGTLRVTATVAFARIQVVPLVAAFLDRHPDSTLQLELTDRRVDLIEEGIDAAIRLSDQVAEPSIVARKLAPNRRIVCATPGYLAAHGTPKTPDDLLRHNCLHMYTLARFNGWEFEDADGAHMIRVNGRLRANTADALYQAVLAGVGVGRLATFLVGGDIKAGRLVALLPAYTHEKSAIYVLYPHRRDLPPKVRAFVDFLVEKFTPVPPWKPD
jgi:DNA-binding transcriptional LysR family regulator